MCVNSLHLRARAPTHTHTHTHTHTPYLVYQRLYMGFDPRLSVHYAGAVSRKRGSTCNVLRLSVGKWFNTHTLNFTKSMNEL